MFKSKRNKATAEKRNSGKAKLDNVSAAKSAIAAANKPTIPVKQAAYIVLAFGLCVSSIMMFFTEPEISRPFFSQPFNIYRVLIMALAITFLLLATKETWLAKVKANEVISNAETDGAQKWLKRAAIIFPLLALAFMIIQLVNPEFASVLVRKEDWPWFRNAIFVKCACQLVGMVCFIMIARRYAKNKKWLAMACSILIALIFFVMAGEELSWGQRIFNWDSPEFVVENNLQAETNLHNFATQAFQNVLYFGGWLLLIAFSFWRNGLSKLVSKCKKIRFLEDWLPPLAFVLIFGVSFGFGDPLRSETGLYYGSNLFIVVAVAVLLIAMIVRSVKHRSKADTVWSTIILVLFTFILVANMYFSDVWDINAGAPTEYLEMFISFGLMSWALVVRSRICKSSVI